MANYSCVDILLVEDNPGDIMLINDALAETIVKPGIINVKSGVEAMKFIRREAPYEDSPRPRIIILDLNLPGKSGQSVLKEIKSDSVFTLIPVIIFSGSDAPNDILNCYRTGANCYVVKPRDLYNFTETIRSLVDFWFNRVKLPTE